jgi:hypothetical protein
VFEFYHIEKGSGEDKEEEKGEEEEPEGWCFLDQVPLCRIW